MFCLLYSMRYKGLERGAGGLQKGGTYLTGLDVGDQAAVPKAAPVVPGPQISSLRHLELSFQLRRPVVAFSSSS